MSINRRVLLQAGAAMGLAPGLVPLLRAQETNWPQAPVKVIVPFSAGGAADTLTRRLAERLQQRWNQPWAVDNRTGAGGNIGMEAVKSSPADGYTIGSATIGTLTINQFLYAKLPYDPVADFAYVSKIWENCNVFVVPPEHPANSVKEFIEWARRKPEGVTYGSAGVGTTPHLSGALFGNRTGLQALHVPFRGAAQSMPALMGGQVDFAIDNIASYMPLIRANKVKALAITMGERWPTLQEVPTMAEAGVPDFIITSWGAFVVPKATPAAVVNKLSMAIQELSREPATREQWLQAGSLAVSSTPAETAAFAERERAKWREVVRISGAKVE
ncbi:Bug family tripartite tricarboxylate transporter substrate binding protein [Piscinibacter sakaiensis]|uniref:Bug family tripartite tricarboxylate transporter substrate binding protein n=1 Tax=Piscinibacter sakaiensis TaxID=1547922 RepID=UPI003AAEB6F0